MQKRIKLIKIPIENFLEVFFNLQNGNTESGLKFHSIVNIPQENLEVVGAFYDEITESFYLKVTHESFKPSLPGNPYEIIIPIIKCIYGNRFKNSFGAKNILILEE